MYFQVFLSIYVYVYVYVYIYVFTRSCLFPQVMAAVESHGAREDPAFKNILQRIAQALQGALAE